MESNEPRKVKKGPALLAAAMLTPTIVAGKNNVQEEGAVMAIFWKCYDEIREGLKERCECEAEKPSGD